MKTMLIAETAKFCNMFDRFFDCLNSRNLSEGKKKRKPDLDPYRSINDSRFKVNIHCMYLIHFVIKLSCFALVLEEEF